MAATEALGPARVPAPKEAPIVPVLEARPPAPSARVDLEAGPGSQRDEDRRRRIGNRALRRGSPAGPGGEDGEVPAALAPAGRLPAIRGDRSDPVVHEVKDTDEVAGFDDGPVAEDDPGATMAAELEAEDPARPDRTDPVSAAVELLPGGEDRVEDRRSRRAGRWAGAAATR